MPTFIDLAGNTFGRLTAVKRSKNAGKRVTWLCACSCGKQAVVYASKLRNGHTQSCGCFQVERASAANKRHGHSTYPNGGRATKEYQAWSNMLRRCYSQTNKHFADYGGRGIAVCDDWQRSFEAFLRDVGPAPSPRHSIDRIDNNADYSPPNCRWASPQEQARNKRNSVTLDFRGETRLMCEWASVVGISAKRISARLKRGWSVEKTLTTPQH